MTPAAQEVPPPLQECRIQMPGEQGVPQFPQGRYNSGYGNKPGPKYSNDYGNKPGHLITKLLPCPMLSLSLSPLSLSLLSLSLSLSLLMTIM